MRCALLKRRLKINDPIIEVIDLGEKISLLLNHGFNEIKKATTLAEKSGLNESEISRFRNRGDNRINFNKFKGLCNTYPQIPEQVWHQPFEIFAQEMGLANFQKPALATLPTNQPQIQLMGIDFQSRIKDRNILEKRFEIMKGYWEIFRYSISTTTHKYIMYEMLEIKELCQNGYITCSVYDGSSVYSGYCFFIDGITYFLLEESSLLNELSFIVTNSPNRNIKPILNGILISLTGGGTEFIAIPSAVKILLSHIDSIDKIQEKYKLNRNNTSVQKITEKIRIIINSDTTQINDIIPFIDNHVPQDAIPYALRAKLF